MIILKNARFISGSRIYKSGDSVPDNPITRGLVEKGFAVIANDRPAATKREKSEAPRKNDEVNS